MGEEEQDVVVHYIDIVEVFDKDLQLTLADIRGHFGVTGGSLKVGGKVKVVKPDVIVPPGTYVLDIPQRNQANNASSASVPTPAAPTTSTIPTPAAPTTSTIPTPPTVEPKVTHEPKLTPKPETPLTEPPRDEAAFPKDTPPKEPLQEPTESTEPETKTTRNIQSPPNTPPTKPDSPVNLKRELESIANVEEAKKQKLNDIKQTPLSFAVSHTTTALPTKLMEQQVETKPLPKTLLNPAAFLPTFQKDAQKPPIIKQEDKSIHIKSEEDKINNKENYANYDWKTKINISTTNSGSNRTSSLIASITSTSSKPTTPERKRQKNEIITKILAREADRKTLRETFMNVEQIKEEITEEAKSAMSSSEVLHLCEVSWFNKFRENSGN